MSKELDNAILGTATLSIGSDNIPELVIEPLGDNTFNFNLRGMPNTPLRLIINPQGTYLIENNETVQIQISVLVTKDKRSLS